MAAYERELFWRRLSDGYDALAENESAWAEVQAERDVEARSLGDDLRGDPAPR